MGRADEKTYGLAKEVADGLGFEIEDVEVLGPGRKTILRVSIDKEGGVTLADCEAFSKDFGALLDVEGWMMGAYTLEVSSPGLDRPLKSLEAFRRHVGKTAKVVTREKVEGEHVFVGRIEGAEGGGVVLMVGERRVAIDYGKITRARLEAQVDEDLKKGKGR